MTKANKRMCTPEEYAWSTDVIYLEKDFQLFNENVALKDVLL